MADASAFTKLSGAVGVAGIILASRVAFYWGSQKYLMSCVPAALTNFKQRNGWVKKVQEEIFTTIGGLVLLTFGTYIVTFVNGPSCDLLDTRDCFAGFPSAYRIMDPATFSYYKLELAWYLHQLPKHLLGVGVSDNALMWAHHLSTIILISLAMTLGLHRSAAVILALLNISNPFLHIAKICNILDFKLLKVVLFAFFALVFLLTRVVAYPLIILKSTCVDSIKVQPRLWVGGDLSWVYFTINGFLVAIYFMQIKWMQGIMRILLQAVSPKGTAEELAHIANHHDSVIHPDHTADDVKKEE